VELNFIEESIPKISRVGGAGREAEPWEQHIAPLKEEGRAGKSFRVWTYGKRASAVSRMSSVRERLTKAVPSENWALAVRVVPGTESATQPILDSEGAPTGETEPATQHGVYVQYDGVFTDEQVAANAKAHDERSARVKAARAKALEAKAAGEVPAPDGVPTAPAATAKEEAAARVAAARNKATK
jgi:hypothetical protein